MLVVASMPMFVVMFFGVFAFFLYKMFSTGAKSDVREIFEFYLAANEMLRDDDRKWYGFELTETIDRGEALIHRMPAAPPLVHFAIGALYNRIGDHKSAVRHLANVVENPKADEKAFVYPTPELRSYVKVLRKIERDPADAPLTSAAIRSLERSRRLRGTTLLEESRQAFATHVPMLVNGHASEQASEVEHGSENRSVTDPESNVVHIDLEERNGVSGERVADRNRDRSGSSDDRFSNRKPISEVLHDIYDTKRA